MEDDGINEEYEESLIASREILVDEDEELTWDCSGFKTGPRKFYAYAYRLDDGWPALFYNPIHAEDWTFYFLDDGSGELEVFLDYRRLRRVYTVTSEVTIQVLSMFSSGKRVEGLHLAADFGELQREYREDKDGTVTVHFPDADMEDGDLDVESLLEYADEEFGSSVKLQSQCDDVANFLPVPDYRWKLSLWKYAHVYSDGFESVYELCAGRFGYWFSVTEPRNGYYETLEYDIAMNAVQELLELLNTDPGHAISKIQEDCQLCIRTEYFPNATIRWFDPGYRTRYKRWVTRM